MTQFILRTRPTMAVSPPSMLPAISLRISSADYKPDLLVLYYPVVDISPDGYGSPEL